MREKLGELYATTATNFMAPSASQMANLEVVKERYDKAMSDFKILKTKNEATVQKQAAATGVPFVMKTFADFVAN